MKQYEKKVDVLEGPWESKAFPKGKETTMNIND